MSSHIPGQYGLAVWSPQGGLVCSKNGTKNDGYVVGEHVSKIWKPFGINLDIKQIYAELSCSSVMHYLTMIDKNIFSANL